MSHMCVTIGCSFIFLHYVAYLDYCLHLLDSHSNSAPHHLVVIRGERERLGEGREKEGRPEGREGGLEGRERGRKRGRMSSEGLEHCNIMRNTKIVDT